LDIGLGIPEGIRIKSYSGQFVPSRTLTPINIKMFHNFCLASFFSNIDISVDYIACPRWTAQSEFRRDLWRE